MRSPIELVEVILLLAPRVATACFVAADLGLILALITGNKDVAALMVPTSVTLNGIGTFSVGLDMAMIMQVANRWEWKTISEGSESMGRLARIIA